MRFTLHIAISSLFLGGCGGLKFEIADGDKEAKPEPVVQTIAEAPLAVSIGGDENTPNNAGVLNAQGFVATYSFASSVDQDLSLRIARQSRIGCPNPESAAPKFIWRELDANDTTISEKDIEPDTLFPATANGRYRLETSMKTKRGQCKELSVSFEVRRFPKN